MLAALAVLAVLAGACGGSNATTGDAGAGETVEVAMAARSPLGAYMSDDGGFDAAMANYIGLVDAEIVVCMREQGFEFAPTARDVPEMQRRMTELTLREWVGEYGYGISTSQESFDPTQSEDPNTAIIMGMTNAERDLWREALLGGNPDYGPNGMDQRPLEDQGCVGRGFITTGGDNAIQGLQRLGATYDEREELLLDSPGMVEAVQAWSLCISEAGYSGFDRLDSAEDHIRERFERMQREVSAAGLALSDEEREAWARGEQTDLDPAFFDAGLFELQADEIALAVVDLDCYEAEVRDVHEPMIHALENDLIVEFEDELSSLKGLGQ